MSGLSVVIITLNEERNIARCLDSVKEIADEILVVDSFSTDRTIEICNTFNCRIIRREFNGFSDQKQFAVDEAKNDWVLSLDADEVVSGELNKEILEYKANPPANSENGKPEIHGFFIPFSLIYEGRIMKHSGLRNEKHLRLFNRQQGRFSGRPVHESIEVSGPVGKLNGKIYHYSYLSLEHHVRKINAYTSLAAQDYAKNNRKFTKARVMFRFPVTFFIYYFLRGCYRDGYPGFLWAFMAAFYGSLKTAKTIELKQKKWH
jgi:glycosyltransferase involved in cell wall biosynthesis